VDWLTFNNSYFTEVKAQRDEELLVLPTDAAIFEGEGFRCGDGGLGGKWCQRHRRGAAAWGSASLVALDCLLAQAAD
jgi:hypothetical protein